MFTSLPIDAQLDPGLDSSSEREQRSPTSMPTSPSTSPSEQLSLSHEFETNFVDQSQAGDESSVTEAEQDIECNERRSASIFLTRHHSRSILQGSVTIADGLLSRSPPATLQSSGKKRRVTFCKTVSFSVLNNQHNFSTGSEKKINTMIKKAESCTALPVLSVSSDETETSLAIEGSTCELDLSVSPAAFVKEMLRQPKLLPGSICGNDLISIASQRVKHDTYFLNPSEQQQLAYNSDVVKAVQNNDLKKLRSLLQSGQTMQTANRFGESLLHTACRRGFTEIVDFFINEARVSPRVRDDMGRTPMHDACWSSAAPNHRVMNMLIEDAPELLLSRDKRGHSPFDYARREYWPSWVSFLNEHRQFVVNSLLRSCSGADSGVQLKVELKDTPGQFNESDFIKH